MVAGKDNITTIKLERTTKSRLENLRSYKRETYDEILVKMLEILNVCKVNPERARARLLDLDRKKRKTIRPFMQKRERPALKQIDKQKNNKNSEQKRFRIN